MIEQNIYKLEKFVKRSSKPPVQTVTQFSSLTKNSKLVTTELPSFEIILSTFVGSLSLKKHQTFLKFAMTSKKKFFFIFLKYCESKIEKKKLEKEKRNFVRHNK